MTYLIIGGVLAFVFFLSFIPKMMERRRIMKKANADYARCRGTRHARQLRAAIKRHESALPPFVRERNKINNEMDSLARDELGELRRALAIHLVNGPFVEVHGIGAKLKDRIVEACFDGTLDSLLQAQQVPGVGAEKAVDIRTWVQQMQRNMPQLLQDEFDGKQEVRAKYEQHHNALSMRRTELDQIIQTRRAIVSRASQELEPLKSVTPAHFRAALQRDPKAAARVAAHALGAFPEWEPTPKWFSDVTSDPEKDLDDEG